MATESKLFDFFEVRPPRMQGAPIRAKLLNFCSASPGTLFELLAAFKESHAKSRIISSAFQSSHENFGENQMLETLHGHLVGSLKNKAFKFVIEFTFKHDPNVKVKSLIHQSSDSVTLVNYADKLPPNHDLHMLNIESVVRDVMLVVYQNVNALKLHVVNIVKNHQGESVVIDENQYEVMSDGFTKTSNEPNVSPHFVYATKQERPLGSVHDTFDDTLLSAEISLVDSSIFLNPKHFKKIPNPISEQIIKNFQDRCNRLPRKGFTISSKPLSVRKAFNTGQGMAAFYRAAFSDIARVHPTSREDAQTGLTYLTRNYEGDELGDHFVHVAQLESQISAISDHIRQPLPPIMAQEKVFTIFSTIANMESDRVAQTKHKCSMGPNQILKILSKR